MKGFKFLIKAKKFQPLDWDFFFSAASMMWVWEAFPHVANIGMMKCFKFLIKAKKFQPLDSDFLFFFLFIYLFFQFPNMMWHALLGVLNILSIFKRNNVLAQIILQYFYKMLMWPTSYWFLSKLTINIIFSFTNNLSPYQQFVKKICKIVCISCIIGHINIL